LVRVYWGLDPVTQKRKYKSKTVHGTKKAAESVLTKMLQDRDTGVPADLCRKTLNEYLDEWIQTDAAHRVRGNTLDEYTNLLRRYVRRPLGNKMLRDLTQRDFSMLYYGMLQKGLSPRTVRYTHAVVHSALRQAVRYQLIDHNPTDNVSLPRNHRKEMMAMTRDQVSRFLKAAENDMYFEVFYFAIASGMRPGEYLALKWKDIDWERCTVRVRRTVFWRGTKWEMAEPKTVSSRRPVRMPEQAMRLLRNYRSSRAEMQGSSSITDDALVFSRDGSKPLDRKNLVRRHFKPILKEAGLPDSMRLYDLRHTCASLLLAENEHPKIVSERLGHSSIAITQDVYSHVSPDMQARAAETLGALMEY
jgi:integrase